MAQARNVLFLLGFFLMNAAAGPLYTLTDLGVVPGPFSFSDSAGFAVNNSGQVAGSGSAQAFRWDPVNGMQVMPGLGADGRAINNLGQIAGSSNTEAFVWDPINGRKDL